MQPAYHDTSFFYFRHNTKNVEEKVTLTTPPKKKKDITKRITMFLLLASWKPAYLLAINNYSYYPNVHMPTCICIHVFVIILYVSMWVPRWMLPANDMTKRLVKGHFVHGIVGGIRHLI